MLSVRAAQNQVHGRVRDELAEAERLAGLPTLELVAELRRLAGKAPSAAARAIALELAAGRLEWLARELEGLS